MLCDIFNTCHPEITPFSMLYIGSHRSQAVLQQRNRARVLVAIHKAFVKDQYFGKHEVPKQLQGFMTHTVLGRPKEPLNLSAERTPTFFGARIYFVTPKRRYFHLLWANQNDSHHTIGKRSSRAFQQANQI